MCFTSIVSFHPHNMFVRCYYCPILQMWKLRFLIQSYLPRVTQSLEQSHDLGPGPFFSTFQNLQNSYSEPPPSTDDTFFPSSKAMLADCMTYVLSIPLVLPLTLHTRTSQGRRNRQRGMQRGEIPQAGSTRHFSSRARIRMSSGRCQSL